MRRRRTAHRFGEKRRTTDVMIDEKVDFSGLMLSSDVLEGLKSAGFERPSPIQLKAIPLGRCGLDLIAQAKSGTGKTCVFSVIALESINLAVTSIQVLVLAPTREIAVQIKDVMCSIGQHLKGLQTRVFIGGMPLEDDKNRLKQCHIAIGSPGRIKHLIESKLLQTTSIRLFILDEADKLLDESFEAQVNWIYSTLPVSKQMLALSATYPDHLAVRLKNYMKDPTFVRLNAADPALEGVRHYRRIVPSDSLPHKVFHEKVQSLLKLLSKLSFHQCLIFSNYQIRARNLSETLAKNGWPSTYISGNQGQNERLNAMAKLKEFKCRILISTDLTSRGIDAERVNLVINMDLPHDSETYLHRVGRAGRFGSYGVAVNFVAEGKEVTSLDEIETDCGVTISPLPDDVSKLLSEEMMDACQRSCDKHEVNLTNTKCKDRHDEARNGEHFELVTREVVGDECKVPDRNAVEGMQARTIEQEGSMVEKDVEREDHRLENKIMNTDEVRNVEKKDNGGGDKINASKEVETKTQAGNVQADDNVVEKDVKTEDYMKENHVECSEKARDCQTECSAADSEAASEYQSRDKMKSSGKVEILNESVGNEMKEGVNESRGSETMLNVNDFAGGFEIEGAWSVEKDRTSEISGYSGMMKDTTNAVIFRNTQANLFSTPPEELSGEDFASEDDSESGISSSEETESTSEGSRDEDSRDEDSRDTHVPISCKDFDSVLEAYLEESARERLDNDNKESKSSTLCESLKSNISEEARDGIAASSDANYANELPRLASEMNVNARASSQSSESRLSEDTNDCIGAQGSADYANEPSGDFIAAQGNNVQNSEESTFYGATSHDVNAYMAGLPAEWKSTWYQVYERQTKFITKYARFCQQNF